MKKTVIFLLIVGFLMISSAAYSHEKGHGKGRIYFTKHFNESLFQITQRADFSVELLLDEKEYKIGKDVIGIIIHDTHDEDVEGAEIKIDIKTDKGNISSAVVKEKGGGHYIAEGVDVKREGRWELMIKVKKKKSEDITVFIFPDVLKDIKPAGKYKK